MSNNPRRVLTLQPAAAQTDFFPNSNWFRPLAPFRLPASLTDTADRRGTPFSSTRAAWSEACNRGHTGLKQQTSDDDDDDPINQLPLHKLQSAAGF